jgi:hypothetical protein
MFLLVALISTVITSTQIINIGSTNLQIPSPVGFAPVTSEMQELRAFLSNFDSPERIVLISFIPDKQIGEALTGKIPDLQRTVHVYTVQKMINRTITPSFFKELKGIYRKQNEDFLNKLSNKLEESTKSSMSSVGKQSGQKLDYQSQETVYLPIHYESDQAISYSMIQKSKINKIDEDVEVITMTYLYLKGKLIYLSTNGSEKDLEWTRKTSTVWANEIIEANRENNSSVFYREFIKYFEESSLWAVKLVGLLGVIAVIRLIIRKRKVT